MAEENKQVKKEKVSLINTGGGTMVNPLTEDRFSGEPSKPVEIDEWIKLQVEAGKLVKAE